MTSDNSFSDNWLTLSEAAKLLDVHPTTIRRWANNGDIPVLVTPGGHRRFSSSDMARFARERSALRNVNGLTGLWATKALANARHEVMVHRRDSWLTHFEDHENRNRNRVLGQRLLGLTLQYLSSESSEENSAAILDEARYIGRQYALYAKEQGLPLRVTLEASMFFRDSLIETALEMPEASSIRPEASVRLLRRINNLLNAVHLAVADVYQDEADADVILGDGG
ncbi:MAG: helix-turn-helix domain-containing protein [Anaerolineae bacterium]|nr:helix-turn-helix domain-containing protein [Anaerolineae bacterium]HNS39014.1 helix-turn-helix domain-containing protein [Promineifilum sp.]